MTYDTCLCYMCYCGTVPFLYFKLLFSMWDEKSMHVLVQLSIHIGSCNFLERFPIENQDEARLAWIGVDD